MYLSVVVIFAWVDRFSCVMAILCCGIVKFSVVDVNSCIVLLINSVLLSAMVIVWVPLLPGCLL